MQQQTQNAAQMEQQRAGAYHGGGGLGLYLSSLPTNLETACSFGCSILHHVLCPALNACYPPKHPAFAFQGAVNHHGYNDRLLMRHAGLKSVSCGGVW